MARTNQVDLLKAGAIFGVLVMHALSSNALVHSWSALYMWQAVPVFMVLMGFVGQWGTVQRRLMRLLVPFALLWAVTLLAAVVLGRHPFALDSLLLRLPIAGPGNYFVTVALAICLLLPLFRRIAKKSALLLLAVTGGFDLAFELAAPHVAFFANHPYFYSAAHSRSVGPLSPGSCLGSPQSWWTRPQFARRQRRNWREKTGMLRSNRKQSAESEQLRDDNVQGHTI